MLLLWCQLVLLGHVLGLKHRNKASASLKCPVFLLLTTGIPPHTVSLINMRKGVTAYYTKISSNVPVVEWEAGQGGVETYETNKVEFSAKVVENSREKPFDNLLRTKAN